MVSLPPTTKNQAYGHVHEWIVEFLGRCIKELSWSHTNQIGDTRHWCTPKKRKRYMGTYMNMSVKSRADAPRNHNSRIKTRWCYCHCQTPNIYIHIRAHMSMSLQAPGPTHQRAARSTSQRHGHGILIRGRNMDILFRVLPAKEGREKRRGRKKMKASQKSDPRKSRVHGN